EVTGYDVHNGVVRRLHTNKGDIACDAVILGLGAWTPKHWAMLGKSMKLDVGYPDGTVVRDKDMWTYWRLREGELTTDFRYRTADDRDPPILKVELMTTPVVDPAGGACLGDYVYFYVKNAAERIGRPGVQGGTIPVMIGSDAVVDPYGHANDLYQAEPEFADYFAAALGQLMGRFEGSRANFRARRNGGIGAFTPDNVPIFDWILPNVYMIADSNHGYKMTGVGKLVAKLLVGGDTPAELEPFAVSRFDEGKAFGNSNSHSPWV
ncbi:MAG: FAD-dependent oxidoreductase, partial [Alphaproteobacteria bacterium]